MTLQLQELLSLFLSLCSRVFDRLPDPHRECSSSSGVGEGIMQNLLIVILISRVSLLLMLPSSSAPLLESTRCEGRLWL